MPEKRALIYSTGNAMAQPNKDTIRPTDAGARQLARELIAKARFGALGVLDPASAAPMVSRIAVARDHAGLPVTLMSDLALHTRALRANPACSLLLGEPGDRGDPLTHPRLTLQCRAEFVPRGSDRHHELRKDFLDQQPKAKLYIDFADFHLVRLCAEAGFLNAGFGKAYRLSATDLAT